MADRNRHEPRHDPAQSDITPIHNVGMCSGIPISLASFGYMTLEGKVAMVTGAYRGIGASTVRKLRQAGVRVDGGARRGDRIKTDVAMALDDTDEASAAACVELCIPYMSTLATLCRYERLAIG